jgi:hypothetical protein
MMSSFPAVELAADVCEGGGTMPQCDEDSEMRYWFKQDAVPVLDEESP